MTFYEARALARIGLHIRREGWASHWFSLCRGVWWRQEASSARPVNTTDYAPADLLATDWTTMPAPLVACVIDPETGSTGGTVALPSGEFPILPAPPGSSSGSPSFPSGSLPGGPRPVPPTPSPFVIPPLPGGGGIPVRLEGLEVNSFEAAGYRDLDLNGTYFARAESDGTWRKTFPRGTYLGGGSPQIVEWTLGISSVIESGIRKFLIDLHCTTSLAQGGFSLIDAVPRGIVAANNISVDDATVGNGTAKLV